MLQDDPVFAEIFSFIQDVLSGGNTAINFDGCIIQRFGMFNHHHAVGAGRQHPAGRNPAGVARCNRKRRRLPHANRVFHGKKRRTTLAGTERG